MNAIVHRSYSNHGDHVRIEIFDDRIEIENPGRFPGVVDVGTVRGVRRFARNPLIARACAELAIGRELGEGIRRMFDVMHAEGMREPVFTQTAGSTQLTLSTGRRDKRLEATVPDTAMSVLRLIADAGHARTGDLVQSTSRSRPWVLEQLRMLQAAGIVERVGSGPRDPRAFWQLRGPAR